MICDHRFPDDTLFMLFEEDYRFWPIGEDPDGVDDYPERLKKAMKRQQDTKAGAYRPDTWTDGPAAGGAKGEAAKGRAKGIRVAGEFHYVPMRQSTTTEVDGGLRQEVADLIRIATFCNRNRMGDIIWFGWNPNKNGKKKTWLWNGSHGLMLTKLGAHHIEIGMNTNAIEREHIDLALAWWLRRPGNAARVQACYICPALGSYFAHPSECDPKNFGEEAGGRPDGWGPPLNPARGTRRATDHLNRAKYVLQWKGTGKDGSDREWIPFPPDAELHSDRFMWKSYKEEPTASLPPPPPPPAADEAEEEEEAAPQQQVGKRKWTKRQGRIFREWKNKQRFRVFTTNINEADFAYHMVVFSSTPIPSPYIPLH